MAGQLLRRAGVNEHRCIARDQLGFYGVVVTTAIHVSNRPVDDHASREELFMRALTYCVATHAPLSIIVTDSQTNTPQCCRPTFLHLKDHLQLKPLLPDQQASLSEQLDTFLTEVHNTPVHENFSTPPWKLVVLPIDANTFCTAFAFSHALWDGTAGLAFQKSLLYGLNHPAPLSASSQIPTKNLPVLLPALGQTPPLPISLSYLLSPVVAQYMPKRLSTFLDMKAAVTPEPPPHMWAGSLGPVEKTPPSQPFSTAIAVQLVPEDILVAATSACRAHSSPDKQVRLTGVLHQLIVRALRTTLATQTASPETIKSPAHYAFVAQTPVDLRAASKGAATADDMVNYSSVEYEVFDNNADDSASFWEAARHTTYALSKRASTMQDQPIGLLRFLSNFRAWLTANASKPSDSSYQLSNVGLFDPRQDNGDWNLKTIAFSQSADATSCPISFNIVSLKAGAMAICITWRRGALGVQDESVFVRDVQSSVRRGLESLPS